MSESFILELGLKTSPEQEKMLLVRLDCARQLYNACLGEALRRLKLMKESQWYQATVKLPKGKDRTREFKALNSWFGLREYDLHSYACICKNSCHIGNHLDTHTCQKVGTRAFNAVQEHMFGKRGKPRFKGKNQFDSVEGKNNSTGIKWREEKVLWSGLELKAKLDSKDKHGIQSHALKHKIKYVRIVRRRIKGKNRFFAQLVLKGKPKQKYESGQEKIGLDLGPSTIACAGETDAFLERFCSELEPIHKEIRRIQRRLDRSRRAMNPENYNKDGTVKKGAKTWKFSGRYIADRERLSEMNRKLAATRKRLHGEMVNRILSLGVNINTEDVSYRAWQKIFGRSIGFRGPGMFIEELRRKAENAGGGVNEISVSNQLSQICHNCGSIKKKSLSTRWHTCDCGIIAQRDLYSAFLAQNVSGDSLDTCRAKETWPGAEPLLRRAVLRSKQSANVQPLYQGLDSFGIRRQSGSHAEGGSAHVETLDDVPIHREGRGEICDTAARTSRL